MLADSHFQWPSEHTCIDHFFDFLDRHIHSVEIGIKAEPRVQTENIPMLSHRFFHNLALADRTRHRLLTPAIFAGTRRFYCHHTMPVRRCSDMDNIDLWMLDQFTEIVALFHAPTESFLRKSSMSGIHITNGYGFSSRIAKVSTSHRTDANDTLGQMITRSKISFAPQYVSRDNREGSGCNHRLFEKVAPRSLIRFQHV